MRIELTKITGGANVRTDSVVGEAKSLPVVGCSFVMLAEPVEDWATHRLVSTSPVVKIDGDIITTETGSQYQVVDITNRN